MKGQLSPHFKGYKTMGYNEFECCIYRVSRAQADWTLILPSATSCESVAPLAKKNFAVQPELLTHIVYFH
jgi:hypothetical protein